MPAVAPIDLDALVSKGRRLYHQEGEKMTGENIQAFNLFFAAAVGGHSGAQFLVFVCCWHGRGIKENRVEAIEWLKRSANAGALAALFQLGRMYDSGKEPEIPRDYDEAVTCYQKVAESGNFIACIMIAGICEERNDVAGQLKWNKEAALLGDLDCFWAVRRYYESTDGATQDLVAAYAWLSLWEDSFTRRKNAREVAVWRFQPESLRYKTTAAEVSSKLSDLEMRTAQRLYQTLLEQRVNWLSKMANDGDAGAQGDLGSCFLSGYGVPQDHTKAATWFKMAADQGEPLAQIDLACCYGHGLGVPKDIPQAHAWFQIAADRGFDIAKRDAAALGALMLPSDLETARQIYRQLKDALPQRP